MRFHYFFLSNHDELRVIQDSDTMSLRIFGGIGSIRLESRKNSLRLENNIRTSCRTATLDFFSIWLNLKSRFLIFATLLLLKNQGY